MLDDLDHYDLFSPFLRKSQKLHGIFNTAEFIRTLVDFLRLTDKDSLLSQYCRRPPLCLLLYTLLGSYD